MLVKCKHCGNEQKYNIRGGKIPKRPKTTCNNKACGKEIYIKKELLTEKTELTEVKMTDMTERIKIPIKPIKIEGPTIDENMIKISSDNFRTAFYLITNSSNRKNIPENKEILEQFFKDYKTVKIGRDYYFQKI